MPTVRVVLPYHLRNLVKAEGELSLRIEGLVTPGTILDALEDRHPVLRGALRDHVTRERRAFLRFFACERDFSLEPPDTPLPEAIVKGKEPFIILGAIAGG